MDYTCNHRTTFDMRGQFIPKNSRNFRWKTIEFNYILKVGISNWIQVSDSITLIEGEDTAATYYTITGADRKFPKRHDVRKVVERAVNKLERQMREGQMHDHERRDIIDRAWEEVQLIFEEDKTLVHACGVIKLDCIAEMHHDHIYVVDLSLEKYAEEVDGDGGSCCICLEDTGGGCLRMPCSHVFHGGCIKQWLWNSNNCPVCRYEMPTQ